MKALNRSIAVIKKGSYYVCVLSMVMIALMMVLMFVDAMLGLFFNSRITGSYELVQCMLCIVVFSSWAYTQTEHGHIHVVMFVRMMPRIPRFVCFSITSILSAVTLGFASYALLGQIQAKIANGECTGTLLIPYWPFYIFEFIAFAMLTLALLADALKSIIAIVDKETGEEVMKSWT